MTSYEIIAHNEMLMWEKKMARKPSLTGRVTRKMQYWINRRIPEKVHVAITEVIRQMIKGVLFGAKYVTQVPLTGISFLEREKKVKERIEFYKKTAAAEGGVAGMTGFVGAVADFPVLIGIKIKLLFEIAAIYGHDVKELKERMYILHIFQLTFSSQHHRRQVFELMKNWEMEFANETGNQSEVEWRKFQQEYRDYLDLAKLAQLIPGIGAVVGAVVNYRLLDQLGQNAINAYRMRWFETSKVTSITF